MKEQVDYCVSKNVGWKMQKECNNNCKLPVGICSMSNPPCGSQECIDNGLLGQFMCVAGSVEKMVSDDPCAVGPCSTDELCRVTDGEATCTKRSQLGACCEAFATCGADESMRESPCTQAELLSKSCYRNSICCNEVFCITESAKPAVFDNCASKPCPDGFVCSGGPESLTSSFVCTSKPTNCCEALPSCKDSDITSNTPCQQGETGCYREQMCCEEVFCREPKKTRWMKSTAGCATQPCRSSDFCVEDETQYNCVDAVERCGDVRCLAFSIDCPVGMEVSERPCDENDYNLGNCIRLSNPLCCQERFCKVICNSEKSSSLEWIWIVIGSSIGVIVISLIGLCVWKLSSGHSASSPSKQTSLCRVSVVSSLGKGESGDFMYPSIKEVPMPPPVVS